MFLQQITSESSEGTRSTSLGIMHQEGNDVRNSLGSTRHSRGTAGKNVLQLAVAIHDELLAVKLWYSFGWEFTIFHLFTLWESFVHYFYRKQLNKHTQMELNLRFVSIMKLDFIMFSLIWVCLQRFIQIESWH